MWAKGALFTQLGFNTTLSIKTNSIPQATFLVNRELEKFYNWAVANKLSINFDIDKTYFMIHTFRNFALSGLSFKLGNYTLPKCDASKFLGVIVDSKLKFKNHIDYISKKNLQVYWYNLQTF